MEKLGRYELLARIGHGGMAEVFLAQLRGAEGFTRQLVVKRMRPELSSRSDAVRMFLDEARICSNLFHPNLVQVFDLGQVDGQYFIAMEFVDGPHLGRLVRHLIKQEQPLPLTQCAFIVHGAAQGLDFAHNAPDPDTGKPMQIVHRDISPHNILVSRFGDTKVVDFGVAKAKNSDAETKSGVVKGKVFYMSPEQVLGEELDRRSDVFALGIVLFEVCTGRRLFKQKTELQSMQLITQEDAPSANAYNPEIDDELNAIIRDALARDRNRRTPSMRDFSEQLAAWISKRTQKHLKTELADLVQQHAEALIPSKRAEAAHVAARAQSAGNLNDFHEQETNIERPLTKPTQTARGTGESSDVSLSTRAFGRMKTNLSPHGARFIGRKKVLNDLKALFEQGTPLLTLVGPGGTGKTRLALRYAERHLPALDHDGGGAWLIDCTDVRGVEGVCGKVGDVLSIPLVEGETPRELSDLIGRALAGRGTTLLIFDNFETQVQHGTETIQRWMSAAPNITFLVTSREVLRLPNEAVYELDPLSVPDSDDVRVVEKSEAVQLFVERAKRARPGFTLDGADAQVVAQIVRRLDGIPLAIELAAARIRVLKPQKILERLRRRFDLLKGGSRDLSPRQTTMRGTLDWSWEMLSETERTAFGQCSVFRGGFSLEAAEAVIDIGDADDWALDVVQALRDKSLLKSFEVPSMPDETRFAMYESIREYAREKLNDVQGKMPAFGRHSAFYLELGETWAAEASGRESRAALDHLALEAANIKAVLARAQKTGDGESALRAAVALAPLFAARGPFQDQIRLTSAALDLAPDDVDAAVAVEANIALGRAHRRVGDIAKSRAAFAAGLVRARAAGDSALQGVVLRDLGVLALDEGRLVDAERNFLDALEKTSSAGRPRDAAETEAYLAFLFDERGDRKTAEMYYEKSLAGLRRAGDRRLEALVMGNYGGLKQELGDSEGARKSYETAVKLLVEVGDKTYEGPFKGYLGVLAHERGALDTAKLHLTEALFVMRETGNLRYEGLMMGYLAAVLAARGDADGAETLFRKADERIQAIGDPRHIDCAKLQRGFLELCLARKARDADNEEGFDALIKRVKERLATAKAVGATTSAHPDGAPAPYDESDEVRRTYKMLDAALRATTATIV